MGYKAVIIDDEKEARELLKAALTEQAPEIEVIAEGNGVANGLEIIAAHQPDLVFLDIQMGDGTGFDLLDRLETRPFKLVFATGFDNFGVKAFQYSAIDYLLKPVDPDELVRVMSKLDELDFGIKREQMDILNTMRDEAPPEQIAFRTKTKIHIVRLEEIIRCQADANYSYIYTSTQGRLVISKPLAHVAKLLTQSNFLRVHQSHLINLKFVQTILVEGGDRVLMPDEFEVPVSRRRKEELYNKLNLS